MPPMTCMALWTAFWQDSVMNFFDSETSRRTRLTSAPASTAAAVMRAMARQASSSMAASATWKLTPWNWLITCPKALRRAV
ncbi:MAG: hypothetical protein A4E67_00080 [Syntrophaceae bacterium PtaB.Bin038]|nr:MAG: hypothetical protein A4E67_00080 [Syntrophaceae bacterium PtaB.Bin038]